MVPTLSKCMILQNVLTYNFITKQDICIKFYSLIAILYRYNTIKFHEVPMTHFNFMASLVNNRNSKKIGKFSTENRFFLLGRNRWISKLPFLDTYMCPLSPHIGGFFGLARRALSPKISIVVVSLT